MKPIKNFILISVCFLSLLSANNTDLNKIKTKADSLLNIADSLYEISNEIDDKE